MSAKHLGLPATKIICVPAIGPAHYQTILISPRKICLECGTISDTKPLGPLNGNSSKLYRKSPWKTTGFASDAEFIYISDFLKTFFFFSKRLILSTTLYSTVLGGNFNISPILRTKKFSDITGIANFVAVILTACKPMPSENYTALLRQKST